MVRARKYTAKFALSVSPGEPIHLAILEERFKGLDTWASRNNRRPLYEVDSELRKMAVDDIMRLASTKESPLLKPGLAMSQEHAVPEDFSGIVLYDVHRESNNVNGVVGTHYKKTREIPYLNPRISGAAQESAT